MSTEKKSLPDTQSAPSFEQSLKKLEKLAVELEAEDIGLDKALTLYEEGVQLAQRCQNALNKAEQKVQVLSKAEDGQIVAQDLNNHDSER